MASSESVTLTEAVTLYIGSIKAKDNHEQVHRELYRFVHWCGQQKTLSQISPPEVGEYAEQMGGTGTTPQAAERLQIVRNFLSYAKKKGLVDTNLAQHIRIRKARPRKRIDEVRGRPEVVGLTPEGHAQLLSQLEKLKADRANVSVEIHRAAADKDVRENAPLEAAREQQGQIESRILEIEETLRSAVIIDPSEQQGPMPTVKLGARVSLKDLDSGRETSYTVVSRSEANPLEGKISDVSPLGKELMYGSAGQEVDVQTPRGVTRYRILKVSS